MKLEEIKAGMLLEGLLPGKPASVVHVQPMGADALLLVYLDGNEVQEQCASGNFFQEENFVVARVDQLSRNEDYKALLSKTEWDLVIVDEAHKMSAHYFGKELKKTQRGPYYIRNILEKELGFGVTNETYDIAQLMTKAQKAEETL